MVMQTLGASLEACMQRLSGRYSRYLHLEHVLPKGLFPFAGRYESKVLAPEYLPHALRRVHARAVGAGLVRRAVDYPSHAGLERGAALGAVQVRHPHRGLGADCPQLELVRGGRHSRGPCSMINSSARATLEMSGAEFHCWAAEGGFSLAS
jgi:hypothetical protein